jgi:hypothetical protein
MSKKVYVKCKSSYHEYTEWIHKTPTTEFVFTHNSKTGLFTGQRTGDNEYSGFGSIEAQRVISELNLVLVGLPT